MSTDKYLDKEGLIYVWSKIKAITNAKVDKETGKGLSTNDYTTTEKNNSSRKPQCFVQSDRHLEIRI